jgi:hypothetical protein
VGTGTQWIKGNTIHSREQVLRSPLPSGGLIGRGLASRTPAPRRGAAVRPISARGSAGTANALSCFMKQLRQSLYSPLFSPQFSQYFPLYGLLAAYADRTRRLRAHYVIQPALRAYVVSRAVPMDFHFCFSVGMGETNSCVVGDRNFHNCTFDIGCSRLRLQNAIASKLLSKYLLPLLHSTRYICFILNLSFF